MSSYTHLITYSFMHAHVHGSHSPNGSKAGHTHNHVHSVARSHRAFMLAIGLNTAIIVLQTVYGWLAHSTALLADAGHNLSDVLGLALAWGAVWLSQKESSNQFTFGFRSSSILASLLNAVLLLLASGAIILEALNRFKHPVPVAGGIVFYVALLSMFINGGSAWLFLKGSQQDLNIRSAFLHLLGDAAVSAAVAISGLLVMWTGWHWLDPATSILVVAVIIYATWGLLRDALRLALHAVPANVNAKKVEAYLAQLPGVQAVHHLHIWGLSTMDNSLTAHLVMPAGHPGDAFLETVTHTLAHHHAIHHATLQIDLGTSEYSCSLNNKTSV